MNIAKKLLIIPAVLIGVVILVLAVKSRPTPSLNPAVNKGRLVEVIEMKPIALAPEVVGYGRVTPKVEWQGIAEVSGRVVYRSPELERGRVVDAGTVLLRIDPLDYELKLAQAEADLRSAQAQLTKLTQEEKNAKTQLGLEKQRLAISQQELKRKLDLREKGLISQSDADNEQQSVLASQRTVQDLESTLFVLPDERKVLQAQVSVNESRVDEAKRSLAKTEVILPIDARIADVDVELDQVVNLQQVMMVGHGIEAVEIDAQIAIHDMAILSGSYDQYSAHSDGQPRGDTLDLGATIQLSSGNQQYFWDAEVSRISDSVNQSQATIGIILNVEQDYRQIDPTQAPPLVNGMFVEAKLTGRQQPHLVVPERAIHGDSVYLYRDGKLHIQTVMVKFRQNGMVAVEGEITEGDLLVVNDLLPAVEGMALLLHTMPAAGDEGRARLEDPEEKAQ